MSPMSNPLRHTLSNQWSRNGGGGGGGGMATLTLLKGGLLNYCTRKVFAIMCVCEIV